MAIINELSGYYGFTIDGLDGSIDANGCVDRVIFAITYPLRSRDVNFSISRGSEDWAVKMGNDEIIPLSNPQILFQNRDNSIVEFTMSKRYPSNSPCSLVYRSNTASWNAVETDTVRPFTPNTFSGWFGFTVEGYGGVTTSDGKVNRSIFTIPFPPTSVNITFEISSDPSHWGARMPNGDIIPLRNPTVVFTNADNAVVVFDMDSNYPSNSPCLLVYRSSGAKVTVKAEWDEKFIPVDDITNVPEEIPVGTTFDLLNAIITPLNASIQTIQWTLTSGYANLTSNTITPTSEGYIYLNALIIGGKGEMSNFSKTFRIYASPAVPVITSQPEPEFNVAYGNISGAMVVTASIIMGTLNYQWMLYNSDKDEWENVPGATNQIMYIPTNLLPGHYYYCCVVGASGNAKSVVSDQVHVYVYKAAEGVTITPKITQLPVSFQRQVFAEISPPDADDPEVQWESSNESVATINRYGVIEAKFVGNTTIKATTSDGRRSDSFNLQVVGFVPVTGITNVPSLARVGEVTSLAGATVVPSNASSKEIVWSIVNDYGTDAILDTEHQTLMIPSSTGQYGSCTIRATIADGKAGGVYYQEDFQILVQTAFVPVNSIAIAVDYTRANKPLVLDTVVVPNYASYTAIILKIENDGGTGAAYDERTRTLTALRAGTVTMLATVIKGLSETRDYTQRIPITIKDAEVRVTDITDVPDMFEVNTNTQINAVVVPTNATRQDIEWSINDTPANTIGATISKTGMFRATGLGRVNLLATILDGITEGDDTVSEDDSIDYTKTFLVEVVRFVKVTGINDVPTKMAAGSTIQLTGTVVPEDATKKTIVWTITSTGTTGATINSNRLTASSMGTVKVRATIKNGISITPGVTNKDYTEEFSITVAESITEVTGINGVPSSIAKGDYTFSATVTPNSATYKDITWSVVDAGATQGTFEGAKLTTKNAGTIKVRATVENGINYNIPFTKDFTITITNS